jgi:hypothetical protein
MGLPCQVWTRQTETLPGKRDSPGGTVRGFTSTSGWVATTGPVEGPAWPVFSTVGCAPPTAAVPVDAPAGLAAMPPSWEADVVEAPAEVPAWLAAPVVFWAPINAAAAATTRAAAAAAAAARAA